jgi:hypothetical protein
MKRILNYALNPNKLIFPIWGFYHLHFKNSNESNQIVSQ